jgi:N-acetylglucosaminyldiphosphoundecaprenol N-acetyl-beta-D-mannosaminyltransferase
MDAAMLFGVEIHSVDRKGLLAAFERWLSEPLDRTIFYTNAHCLNVAASQPHFRRILNQADLVYADGLGARWASRFLGQPELHKVTGREWIYEACEILAREGRSLYILAGRPGAASRAAANLQARVQGLVVAGTADGYFEERSERAVLEEIAAARPDVLFVGMGVPRQEIWLAHHRSRLPVRICWAVGALFDLVAGLESEVPPWLDRLALEWLWRLWINPAGKWRRYLLGNPLFVLRVIKQRLGRPGYREA